MKVEYTDEMRQRVYQLRADGFHGDQVARMTGLSRDDVRRIMLCKSHETDKVTADTIVAGERLADRIERLKKHFWEKHLREIESVKYAIRQNHTPTALNPRTLRKRLTK